MGVGAAADTFVRLCTSAGFTVVALGPNAFRAARTRRPQWATVLAICTSIFAGVGLFFLLVKRTESGDAAIVEDRTGTKLRLAGQLPRELVVEISNVLSQPAGFPALAASLSTAPATPAPSMVPPVSVAPSFAPRRSMTLSEDLAATVQRGATLAPPVAPPHSPQPAPIPVLVLPDSRTLAVGSGVVIGRAPQPHESLPAAVRIVFDDVSLSKTHLTVGPAPDGVWVIDHHSTNGTRVVHGMSNVQCVPGARAAAPFGATILAGELQFTVGAS